MISKSCPLCLAEKLTRWFVETDLYWIALCKTCNVPMIVLKRHDTDVTDSEAVAMLFALEHTADEFFGVALWRLDMKCRKIPDHVHWHARLLK